METAIRARNFKLRPDIEEHIGKRLERFDRHVEDLESAEVLLSQQPIRHNSQGFQYVAQFTLHTRHDIVRSEVANDELLTAVDQACDRLSRQLERRKTRLSRRKKGQDGLGRSAASMMNVSTSAPSVVEMAAPAQPPNAYYSAGDQEQADPDEGGAIVRVKRFSIKPMHPEEAVEQMELLGHSFFIFWNADDERMHVLYRRNDGDYGLLEPELS